MVLSDVFFGNIYEIPAKIVTMETRISAQKMPCEKGEIIIVFPLTTSRQPNLHTLVQLNLDKHLQTVKLCVKKLSNVM